MVVKSRAQGCEGKRRESLLAGAFLLKQSYERPGVHEEDAKASANGGAGSARQTTKREERGSDGRKFHRTRLERTSSSCEEQLSY